MSRPPVLAINPGRALQEYRQFRRQTHGIKVRTPVPLLGEIVVDLYELIVAILPAGSETIDIETYCCVSIRLVLFAHACLR